MPNSKIHSEQNLCDFLCQKAHYSSGIRGEITLYAALVSCSY